MTRKLKRLEELRAKVAAGDVTIRENSKQMIEDTDGRMVALTDPDALAAIERRIAAEGTK